MFGGGDVANAFGTEQGKAMEASFKEFLARPENAALVEAQQRKEAKQSIQLQEKIRALEFRDKVLEAEYDAQKNIAPFLENRVLRRIVQTFTNDPSGDFGKWAQNPRVIEMLREAKRLMDEGYLTEDEVEHHILRQLQDPKHEAHEDFKRKTRQVVRLPTDQLVGALNEHLTERRKGNDAYRSGDYVKALHHYERAAAIVELVQGLSRADQAEVDINKVAIYLNLAAVHMAQKEYGAAVGFCDKALELQPGNFKALLRRCRAYTGRHDYAAAEADLETLRDLEPYSIEVAEQAMALERARQVDRRKEASVFGSMFERGSLGTSTA
ncbi:Peptidyl-prolyl cis-trans isomerase D [Chlorella sorokiniana]|uniref:Peptidyl-prolyl cis-trans isomerase D n=1 Tax=Chlorella sorokiniana TaxID=3076 RepID=A0A2P6TK13_CHLSO|nr:Peptidyl-prolyl cis-trans isomerase D [Chlorella sorokiniana]|eukprot:PRW44423.1 Peptidyl-prolyl cis-trans isomerase D [Chlorella sorokiniana]